MFERAQELINRALHESNGVTQWARFPVPGRVAGTGMSLLRKLHEASATLSARSLSNSRPDPDGSDGPDPGASAPRRQRPSLTRPVAPWRRGAEALSLALLSARGARRVPRLSASANFAAR